MAAPFWSKTRPRIVAVSVVCAKEAGTKLSKERKKTSAHVMRLILIDGPLI
jgi:hypothetical protein